MAIEPMADTQQDSTVEELLESTVPAIHDIRNRVLHLSVCDGMTDGGKEMTEAADKLAEAAMWLEWAKAKLGLEPYYPRGKG